MGLIKDCDCELQREDFDCLPTSMRLPWGWKVHDILYKDFWHVFYSLFLYFKRRSINSNCRQFIELFNALFTSSFLLVSPGIFPQTPPSLGLCIVRPHWLKWNNLGCPSVCSRREKRLYFRGYADAEITLNKIPSQSMFYHHHSPTTVYDLSNLFMTYNGS